MGQLLITESSGEKNSSSSAVSHAHIHAQGGKLSQERQKALNTEMRVLSNHPTVDMVRGGQKKQPARLQRL
jgi:hypothetical protein